MFYHKIDFYNFFNQFKSKFVTVMFLVLFEMYYEIFRLKDKLT